MTRLRAENQRLRLELFWTRHSIMQLERRMQRANNRDGEGLPRCACMVCARTRRSYRGRDEGAVPCAFKPWFEAQLAACGMEARIVAPTLSRTDRRSVDAHFAHIEFDNWMFFFYGRKLCNATCADDPELAKLHQLFLRLASPKKQ